MQEFWVLWSRCVEHGILRYLGDDMHLDKQNHGRSLVSILTKTAFDVKIANMRITKRSTNTFETSLLAKQLRHLGKPEGVNNMHIGLN